jgi:hypothetical protein
MEWVLAFISDLTKLSDKEFSDPMLNYINNQLEKSRSKLNPKEFRDLYIKKIYSYQGFGRENNRISGNTNFIRNN